MQNPNSLTFYCLLIALLIPSNVSQAQSGLNNSNESKIVGYWVMPDAAALLEIYPVSLKDNDGAAVEISRGNSSEHHYEIRIIAIRDNLFTSADGNHKVGEQRVDLHNPDEKLQGRSLQGLVIGTGFKATRDTLKGGKLYDPGSGNQYKAELMLTEDNLLQVRGYLGISLFGRTLYWHQAESFRQRLEKMFTIIEKPNL